MAVSSLDQIVFAVHDVSEDAKQLSEDELKSSVARCLFFILTRSHLLSAQDWLRVRLSCGLAPAAVVLLDNLFVNESFSLADVDACFPLSFFAAPQDEPSAPAAVAAVAAAAPVPPVPAASAQGGSPQKSNWRVSLAILVLIVACSIVVVQQTRMMKDMKERQGLKETGGSVF